MGASKCSLLLHTSLMVHNLLLPSPGIKPNFFLRSTTTVHCEHCELLDDFSTKISRLGSWEYVPNIGAFLSEFKCGQQESKTRMARMLTVQESLFYDQQICHL